MPFYGLYHLGKKHRGERRKFMNDFHSLLQITSLIPFLYNVTSACLTSVIHISLVIATSFSYTKAYYTDNYKNMQEF